MAKLYITCSILMAALFLISTSVQFNDPDWYFWIPLYAGAAYVNLMNCLTMGSRKRTVDVGNMTLILGEFLLSKVILDNYLGDMAVIWSMDMKERVVREVFGSVLVIISMILQISAASSFDKDHTKENFDVALPTTYGMAILVGMSYSLSLVFMVYHKQRE